MSTVEDFLDKAEWEGLDYAAAEWDWSDLKIADPSLYKYIEDYRRAFKRLQDYVDFLIEEEI